MSLIRSSDTSFPSYTVQSYETIKRSSKAMSIEFENIINFRDVGKTVNDYLGRKHVLPVSHLPNTRINVSVPSPLAHS